MGGLQAALDEEAATSSQIESPCRSVAIARRRALEARMQLYAATSMQAFCRGYRVRTIMWNIA